MSTRPAPRVDCARQHASLPVRDMRTALAFYTAMGFEVTFTWEEPPTFAGVRLGESEIFLELTGEGDRRGGTVCFEIGDADELFEHQRAGGAEVIAPPADRPYGIRDYMIRDPDGNRLVFGHPIYTLGEPVAIERVEVPVRLEKRLAALIEDLAKWKRMSLSSCLEEILLHTCEPLGDGVASPHTARDLRHIQELKARHGIDYDTHASYRFVERTGQTE
jgi:catechol 2,3-dioxygenase-like lactoylglutathione lyase family enzyme